MSDRTSQPRDLGGRLPLLSPDELDPQQREVYEGIAGGPRAGGPFRVADDEGHLLGPFNAMLHAPAVGSALQRLGATLRFSTDLPDRTRELVICAVGAHWDSDYEWYAHSRVARRVGIDEAELDGVRRGRVPGSVSAAESSALRLTHALLRDRAVGEDLFADVVEHHGRSGLVELCALVGYYQLLGGVLAAADVPAPADPDDGGS